MSWADKVVEKIRKCPGLLTAKNKLVDYSEIHSLLLGIAPYILASRLDMLWLQRFLIVLGMGALIGYSALKDKLVSKYVNVGELELNQDISKEPHYFFAGLAIAEIILTVVM